MSKLNISSTVRNQLPEFIRGDTSYENFMLFLEAYYKFLEQTNKRNIEEIRDLDISLTEFINQFKTEFDYNNVNYQGNQSLLLRHIRNLYESKGSEASYRLLFRLLYNKDVDVIYPSDYIFRSSDGKWIQEISLFIDISQGDAISLVGKEVTINSNINSTKVFVEKVKFITGTTYQFFINKNYYNVISVGDILQTDGVVGEVIPTTIKLKIERAGENYNVGQVFNIQSSSGFNSVIKVTRVDTVGGILSAQFMQFGVGYPNDFLLDLGSSFILNNDTSISTSTTVDAHDYIAGINDSGDISLQDFFDSDYGDDTYVGTTLTSWNNSSNNTLNNSCVLRISVGAIGKFAGYFSTNDSFLSDTIYLQDSKYYQVYSYVLKVEEQLETYKDLVKSYLHPSGLALFGQYEITNQFNLTPAITTL